MNRANSSSSMEAISELPGNVPGHAGTFAADVRHEQEDGVGVRTRAERHGHHGGALVDLSGGNQLALDGERAGIFQLAKLLE